MREIGIIAQKMNERSGTSSDGKAWASAEYLIAVPAQFPREMLVKVFDKGNGRIPRFDALIGQMANIDFEVKAREYNGKWYNDLNAWNATPYHATEPVEKKSVLDSSSPVFANIPAAPPSTGAPNDDLPY